MASNPSPLNFTDAPAEPVKPAAADEAPDTALELSEPLPEEDLGPPPTPVATAANTALAPALEPGVVLTRLGESQTGRTGVYLLSGLASLLWIAALGVFTYLNLPRGGLAPLTIALLALLAIAPTGLILAGAYVVAQARTLAAE